MSNFAIIGYGKMGRYYDKSVNARYVVDALPVHNRLYFNTVEEFVSYHPNIDLAIISTPSDTHFRIAQLLLENNYNVLVEKPICLTVGECISLEKIASQNRRILYQSTLERYNPVVMFIKSNILMGSVSHIESFRYGPKPNRAYVEDPIWDLGIHDVDLYYFLKAESTRWEVNVGYSQIPRREIRITFHSKKQITFDLINMFLYYDDKELDIGSGIKNNPMIQMTNDVLYKGILANEPWNRELKILETAHNSKITIG